MNEKISKLVYIILEDEKLLDKIIKTDNFDELYDIIISTQSNLNITKKELKDFMEKHTEELNDEQLSEIAGGVKDLKGKIMPSVVASMLSLLTVAQTGASAVGNKGTSSPPVSAVTSKEKPEGKGFIAKNIGELTTSGLAFLTVVGAYLIKSNKISGYEKELSKKTTEELIQMLPGAWAKFLAAWEAARYANIEATYQATMETARGGGFAARQKADFMGEVFVNARLAAEYATTKAAWEAAGAYAWQAHLNAGWRADMDGATDAARVAARDAARDAAWAVAWSEPVGAAYLLVQYNNRQYFVNLLKVLREQTVMLDRIAHAD